MSGEPAKQTEWWSAILGLSFPVLVFASWGRDAWPSKIWYVIRFQVSFAQVIKPVEPHNCDWFTAPLGSKNCHYEAQVESIRTSTGTDGKPLVSYDDGKTWVANDGVPPAEPRVFITWQKIED